MITAYEKYGRKCLMFVIEGTWTEGQETATRSVLCCSILEGPHLTLISNNAAPLR